MRILELPLLPTSLHGASEPAIDSRREAHGTRDTHNLYGTNMSHYQRVSNPSVISIERHAGPALEWWS